MSTTKQGVPITMDYHVGLRLHAYPEVRSPNSKVRGPKYVVQSPYTKVLSSSDIGLMALDFGPEVHSPIPGRHRASDFGIQTMEHQTVGTPCFVVSTP